jgi:uncharacterized protein YbjT (DUF2867 family)
MGRILVTGATGTIGRQVLAQLTKLGADVAAMSRRPGSHGLIGDFTRPETLDACLRGIDTVFLVWTAPASAIAPAIDLITRRVRRVVYVSAPIKTPHPFFQQPNPLRDMSAEIERRIEASGVEWTVLRPGMFAANAIGWWGPQFRAGDTIRWPYLSAPTAPIHEVDIATIAVSALCDRGHAGKDYVLTGTQSLTQREQIATIGDALGRPLRIEEMSPEDVRREWQSWPPAVIDMLLNAWASAVGQPAWVTSTFVELTGTTPRTFRQWAVDHAKVFARGST